MVPLTNSVKPFAIHSVAEMRSNSENILVDH